MQLYQLSTDLPKKAAMNQLDKNMWTDGGWQHLGDILYCICLGTSDVTYTNTFTNSDTLASLSLDITRQVKLCYVAKAPDTYVSFQLYFLGCIFLLNIKIILHACFCTKTLPRFGYVAS
jgi:hypothetical protein